MRGAAVAALAQLEDPRAREELGRLLGRTLDEREFSSALAAWAKLTGEPATVPLARFVRVVTRGEHHELRRAVIEALGSTRSAAAIAPLQAVIAEGYPSNTRAAATALGTTERAEGLDALQRLFQSQPQLAISAAVGLGRGLAAPWIESIISEAKLQKDADLEEAAQRALRQLRE